MSDDQQAVGPAAMRPRPAGEEADLRQSQQIRGGRASGVERLTEVLESLPRRR
ncbi:hypothetical protein ITP53_52475 [Nonomuraea sp. K274]|uniref:Uncharacterized protein n=1 Tax=Nonomuraea cypriaca TaxID=1187855 RepID=A0A931F4X8_9ACTN|nr:hypothetical protein [Nonomuraea cypriaca]MBF8194150.1 hypothetical protein [Nonomuraea cypriaca]